MIMTSEHIRVCPMCGSDQLTKDYVREELYCASCGIVLSSAVQYVGLVKVENIVPYSASSEARSVVHHKWIGDEDKGKMQNREVTNYRHSIPNWQLMKRGRRKSR